MSHFMVFNVVGFFCIAFGGIMGIAVAFDAGRKGNKRTRNIAMVIFVILFLMGLYSFVISMQNVKGHNVWEDLAEKTPEKIE